MSDEGEIDVESDDVADVGDIRESALSPKGMGVPVDKRAHHNALERKRRDHIKDSFTGLRDSIPSLVGEKVSRAHVLNKATDYIRQMQKNSSNRNLEIEELTRKNEILEEQLAALEQAKVLGNLDNPEELLASITGKVHQRQLIRQQQAAAVKTVGKVQLEQEVAKDKAPPTELSPSILASNLRTTQNILSALAKIPNNTSTAQVRNLAAKVLASPLRTTGVSVPPRGFVTATTVPSSGTPGLVKVTPIQATPSATTLANNVASNNVPSSVATPSINTATPTVDINTLNAVLAGLANNVAVSGGNSMMELVSMPTTSNVLDQIAPERKEETSNGDDPPNKRFKSDPES